jgi:SM-20-related protein
MAAASVLDFAGFDATPLQRVPCDYLIVPQFVRTEALKRINADYPSIAEPGNFPLEGLSYGPAFGKLVEEMTGAEMRHHFAAKFGIELDHLATTLTVRRYVAPSDGDVHNDSRRKKITVLIYLNEQWDQRGGQLRFVRPSQDVEDFYVEVPPVGGTLVAFRRNDQSFHGFARATGERRNVQMYWVEPRSKNKDKFRKRSIIHRVYRRIFARRD